MKLGLRGSRSGPRGPDFPRKLSGPVRSKTPSCVRETGEDSARIVSLPYFAQCGPNTKEGTIWI